MGMPEEQDVVQPIDELSRTEKAENPSILDQVREDARSLLHDAAEAVLDLDLPGYRGLLVGRYGLVEGELLNKTGRKIRTQSSSEAERILNAASDTIILANQGIFIRKDEDMPDVLEPMMDRETQEIVTYSSPYLAEFLGFEAGTARENLIKTFAGNEAAVLTHAIRINRWMSDTNMETDNAIMGGI